MDAFSNTRLLEFAKVSNWSSQCISGCTFDFSHWKISMALFLALFLAFFYSINFVTKFPAISVSIAFVRWRRLCRSGNVASIRDASVDEIARRRSSKNVAGKAKRRSSFSTFSSLASSRRRHCLNRLPIRDWELFVMTSCDSTCDVTIVVTPTDNVSAWVNVY